MKKDLPFLLGIFRSALAIVISRKVWGTVTLLLIWSVQSISYGQQSTVTGQVISLDDQLPVPGVTVTLKGTNSGTVTNADGSYRLEVPNLEGTLVFSFVGYATQELNINGRSL